VTRPASTRQRRHGVLSESAITRSKSAARGAGPRHTIRRSPGAGTAVPIVGRAIIRDCYHGADAQRLMSAVSMIFSIAPAVAPIVGGWVLLVASWHGIFWLLAAFSLLLALVCVRALPETHPPAARVPHTLSSLLSTYRTIVRDRQFGPLAFASTFNFGALFLYIASAPVFVLDILGLNAQQFAWLFVPAISGMLLGAVLSNRMAGRFTAAQTVNLGYAIMLVATAINIALTIALPQARVPWSVLPIGLHAIGIALSFPTVTLLILDRFPLHRGAASSMQAFVSLVFSAIIAGVISPLVSHHALWLACGAGTMTVVGFIAWRVYRRGVKAPALN